ncbi:hypothetical protein GCM10027360_19570 [Amycolatopsis echigonensis]
MVRWGTPKLIVPTVWGCLSRRERCLDKHPQTAEEASYRGAGVVWVLGGMGARVRGWCGCWVSWVRGCGLVSGARVGWVVAWGSRVRFRDSMAHWVCGMH